MRPIVSCLLLCCLSLNPALAKAPDSLVEASVTVFVPGGSGSGVIASNGDVCYVWTAGHVVMDCEEVKNVIDPATGTQKVQFRYRPVTVMQEEIQNGKKVAEHTYIANIIRFSPPRKGLDLALLQVVKKNAFSSSVRFTKKIPKVGTSIWHVGSMNGRDGAQSTAAGNVARVGRIREGHTYDQVSVAAMPGSSGGGVFEKSSGLCLGLLTEGMDNTSESTNFIVPAREILEFAKRTRCEWAVNPTVPIPNLDTTPVRDVPLPAPKGQPEEPKTVRLTPTQLFNILFRW